MLKYCHNDIEWFVKNPFLFFTENKKNSSIACLLIKSLKLLKKDR